MEYLQRFKRYADKFRKPTAPQQVQKETVGEIIVDEIQKTVHKRLQEILPLVATGGGVNIRCNTGSFWDLPIKHISLSILVDFDEKVKWKDQEETPKFPEPSVSIEIDVSDFCEKCRPYLHEVPDITNICEECRKKLDKLAKRSGAELFEKK